MNQVWMISGRGIWNFFKNNQSVLEYSNKLTTLWNAIDFYWALPTNIVPKEYILKRRNYHFLTELRLEFEYVRNLLFHQEKPLSFDGSGVQITKEEKQLMSLQTSLPT